MTNWIREYWQQIESGAVLVSRRVRQQYEKLMADLDTPRDPWEFDIERGTEPITFTESFCKHSKGIWAGRPVILELFQKAKLQAVYGFVHKDTRLRKYREVFNLVGRKNGKSTEKAATGLYMLIGDGEGGAEIYSAATKREQAKLVFTEVLNMREQSPDLFKHTRKRKGDLYFPLTFSKFEALSKDSNSMDGLNIHNAIIDEIHAIKDRNLYDVLKQGMGSRSQPLLDIITTGGFVRESIFDDLYAYAEKVLDGEIVDEQFLAFLYELDDRSEWTDPEMWIKANPGLGTIKDYDTLAANVERAKHDSNFLPTVLTKDFNIRDTVAGTWFTFDEINNTASFTMEDIEDTYAVAGADLSSTTDLTCSTLLVLKPGDPIRYALQQYFLPEDLLEKKIKEDKIPYDRWVERGLVTLCPGNKINYTHVTAWFTYMLESHKIHPLWCYYDPWNSKYWIDEMEQAGFKMVVARQGYQTLSQPAKELAADLIGKRINYNNNPVLKWCLTNTSVKRDENDNIRPIKGQNQKQRIDGTVSLLTAYVGFFEHMKELMAIVGDQICSKPAGES